MQFNKIKIGLAGLLLVVAAVFSFTPQQVEKKKTDVIYHYKSSSDLLASMKNIENWEVVEEALDCGFTGDLPCTKLYEDNINAFQTYLNGFSTAAALAAAADERKP